MIQSKWFLIRKETCLLAVAFSVMSGMNAYAQNPADVRACIQNIPNPVTIGNLTWQIRNGQRGHYIEAQFDFANGWGHLDDHYDFRWFQIVKRDPSPPRWNNNGTFQRPGIPYVDPPAGGWDTNNDNIIDDPADMSPYYEDDAGFGGRFDFRNWHTERLNSRFQDAPFSSTIGTVVEFQTFLAVVLHGQNTFQNNQRNFLKLIAFDWTMTIVNAGTQQNPIPRVQISASGGPINMNEKKQDIRNALNNSGFQNWSSLNAGCLVPEPASMTALGIGLLTLLARRRRRLA